MSNRFINKINIILEIAIGYDTFFDINLKKKIEENILNFFRNQETVSFGIFENYKNNIFLDKYVRKIEILKKNESDDIYHEIITSSAEFEIILYYLHAEAASEECADCDEEIPACSQWVLPNKEFEDLWSNLYYDSEIKDDLLNFAITALLYSDKSVNMSVINWNRVVLLHGPPGTGKTSLCKALAQKLSIRLSNRYITGQLLEINAHSLFSKWFSESGKLVMKMFQKIRELIEDSQSFVCVLIDEVESLAASRQAATGSDPSDAMRVVNALLTQIDSLNSSPNALVLSTSNITGAVDIAFIDRADIKKYIPLPNFRCRFEVMKSCLSELIRVGIVESCNELPCFRSCMDMEDDESIERQLHNISEALEGFSGRAMRKLPLQAHACFLKGASPVHVDDFLKALLSAAQRERSDRNELQ
eukprot:GHVL01036649.1.p1 GENE.GHVL01036649.1~~GHVL01036649.1.p1  ORF type:complete len:418 (-),score=101.97 GHVL01036649.1:1448-2701(-)